MNLRAKRQHRPGAYACGAGRRLTRSAAWLLLAALLTGCAPSGAGTSADVASPRDIPRFGTPADELPVTLVALEPASDGRARQDVHVRARVAADPESQSRGLAGVEHVPAGTGMLFVFPAERVGSFWTKDTDVALDIAFIAGDGTVRSILTMPPCNESPCPIYDPQLSYVAALEVPAGWFAANGVNVGTQASWEPAGVR